MDFLTQFFQVIANMSAASFAQHIVNGISLGSLYALIAIGYTMVYGILLMINFAHADIVMMACYFAFFGITVFHIPWYLTFILVIIATAIIRISSCREWTENLYPSYSVSRYYCLASCFF